MQKIETSSLTDIINANIIGSSESENIQEFPSQGISEVKNLTKITEINSSYGFEPRNVIFFDSVVRLDYVLLTRNSVIGFLTFGLGHIEFEYSKPIDLNKNVKFEVVRRMVVSRSDVKDNSANYSFKVGKLSYDVEVIDGKYLRISDLWHDYVLKKLLPDLEKKYVIDKILSKLGEDSILVKDGLISGLSGGINVFGHVKTFDLNSEIVDSDECLKKNYVSSIYDNGEFYSCYLDLSRGKNSFRRGIFGYSRLDVNKESVQNNLDEVIERFKFISEYFHRLTSILSDSSRFPQNLPIIESLERFLRSKVGDRNIVVFNIMKGVKP